MKPFKRWGIVRLLRTMAILANCNRRAVLIWGCRSVEEARKHPMVRGERIEALQTLLDREPTDGRAATLDLRRSDFSMDLVGTCPKDFWEEWIAEGDAAGDPETGEEWGWYTAHHLAASIKPGDRFYVVSHGRLRGWAPVTGLSKTADGSQWIICRHGNAVACTIDEQIPGFRGLRMRWWNREQERPFPEWKVA